MEKRVLCEQPFICLFGHEKQTFMWKLLPSKKSKAIHPLTNYKPHFYDFVSGFGSTPQANPLFLGLAALCNLSPFLKITNIQRIRKLSLN